MNQNPTMSILLFCVKVWLSLGMVHVKVAPSEDIEGRQFHNYWLLQGTGISFKVFNK